MVRRRRKEAGFTLIEVLVAFAVLGISAGAILSVFSLSPAKIIRAENERWAVLAAKSLIAMEQNNTPVVVGLRQGVLSDNIRWSLSIQPYEEPPTTEEKERATPSLRLYTMSVRTSVGNGHEPATAVLSTLYLGWSGSP